MRVAGQRNPWLPHPPTPTATGRVFLIPYSGCGASMYRQWPRHYAGVDFLPVELPGHETRMREPTYSTYQQLATDMIDGIEPCLDVPFGFFGHCGSALAAYEAAAELVRTGKPPAARIFVSSEVAPQDGPAGRFLEMDDSGLTDELQKLITNLGGTPSPELIDLYLDVLRSDIGVNRRYVVPAPIRLPGAITAIGWTEDNEIPFSAMGGWSACGDTSPVLLAGHHHRFIEAPSELLELLVAGIQGSALGGPSSTESASP